GYQTPVGDDLHSMLPTGCLQRVCFIRSLLLKPKILLLDEMTSSLGEKGDKALQEILGSYKQNMTIFLASPRPFTSSVADQSYVLKNKMLESYKASPNSQSSSRYAYGF
ncbi:MAG TPA: hypothetical protein VI959_00400, partial [Alphaproteobacteria bacterium]|nr:hypothetical protein [Alphaproteobacteria bacterium]